jgi:carbamoyl-phosphate synthase small subunit
MRTAKFKFAYLETRRGSKIPTLERTYSGYKGTFVLEDGSVFEGIGFGYTTSIVGEVVFNTGMVGYTETLTDPSYRGQILCLTYPLVGNYGVPSKEEKDEFGLPKYFESDQIQIKGLLIHNLAALASHWSCIQTLDQWLYEEKIPGIYAIDTRTITKLLRTNGVMKGAMIVERPSISSSTVNSSSAHQDTITKIYENVKRHNYGAQNFMHEVSTKKPIKYSTSGNRSSRTKSIVLLDTGTKYSIIRNILKMGFNVIRLPWDTPIEEVMHHDPVGVVISNGPGDPEICGETVSTASELIRMSKPTLGICLGLQILALAGGAKTYKLKFGHRGQNKPCNDLRNNMTYITSQNHGYGVSPETLEGGEFKIWFSNTDDNTVEGLEHETKPIIAVQFHPEASPGPNDCIFVFRRFKEIVEGIDNSLSHAISDNLERTIFNRDSQYAEAGGKDYTNRENDSQSIGQSFGETLNLSKSEQILKNGNKVTNRRKYDSG